MKINEITYEIIGSAIDIHKAAGPGLLESAYEYALAYELNEKGLDVKQQVGLPFVYKNVRLEIGYRIDLMIEDTVIIEIKSVENVLPVHYAQLLTYLKLSEKPLGLLINFNTKLIKDSIYRMANNL